MRNLYVTYENIYIPTEYTGMIGVINEKWAMITNTEVDIQKERVVYKANYIFIPKNYVSILEGYFKIDII